MSHFCYTCLSEDRELKPLDSSDEVRTTLSEWFDNNSSFQVNVDHFQLCWECYAMVTKLSKFKKQVFKAQQLRFKVQKKKSAHLVSQTNLCIYTKEHYDAEYIFEDRESEETDEEKEKNKTSKRKKDRRHSHTSKSKRHKAPEPDPEPIQRFSKIVNTYNYYNSPHIPDVKETSYVSDAKESELIKEVVDLTKNPKNSAMPVVLLDKEIKQELIDAYEAEGGKISSPLRDYEENKQKAIDMEEAETERHGDDNDGENNSHAEKLVDDLIEIVPCHPCKGIFEGKAAYRAHMQSTHKELAQHAYCAKCDAQYESLEKFKRHVTVHGLFNQLKYESASEDSLVIDITCALCKKAPANKIASLDLRGPRFNVSGNLCSPCLHRLQLQGPPQGCDEMHLKVHMTPNC